MDDYLDSLSIRTKALSKKANSIRRQSIKYDKKIIISDASVSSIIEEIHNEIGVLESEAEILGKRVKRLISYVQKLSNRENFSKIKDEIDELRFHELITKKEFKKFISSFEQH